MTRPQHNHIFQSRREPIRGCPACALIRPEVMNASYGMIRDGIFGPPPTPERRDRP